MAKATKLSASDALDALERRAPANELERLSRFRSDQRGRKGKANTWEVISSILLHPLLGAGTLGEHFESIHGEYLAESSLSERRRNIPLDIFREVLRWLLKPLADQRKHPESFYHGYRLVGLDGTGFSLRNTRSIIRRYDKAVSRRLKAAFARTNVSVLVELGTHSALGAEISGNQESEWNLSCKVLEQLPESSLLLGDRLYGVPKFVQLLAPHCERTSSAFLLRARKDVKSRIVRKLKDGSSIVQIAIQRSERHKKEWSTELREIQATVQRKGQRAFPLRLWTDLLDSKAHPASELAELYAKRWEHELYYRELKHGLHNGDLLNGQTVETSCQEIVALLLATSVIAESRIEIAGEADISNVTVVGFEKALFHTQFILVFKMADDNILTPKQQRAFAKSFRKILAPDKVPKKRSRSCPRAVRQPVKGWPRLTRKQNNYANVEIKIVG